MFEGKGMKLYACIFSSMDTLVRKIREGENKILISLVILVSLFYCFLAKFPKHGDFYSMNYASILFSQGHLDFYRELLINQHMPLGLNPYPPLFFIIEGSWLKFINLFFGVNWNGVVTGDISSYPSNFPILGIIPYLVALFLLVIISYSTLKNKWLCFLGFGTFSFVSIIIMGQIDIFCSLFIFLSLIFFIRGINDKNSRFDSFFSYLLLGISMTIKPFGGLLLPVYIIVSYYLLKSRIIPNGTLFKESLLLFGALCLGYGIIWLPYLSYMIPIISFSESSWLLNLQIAPVQLPPFHTLSLWLLGYIVILYDLFKKIPATGKDRMDKMFLFYAFTSLAWFFITVYTHPQWWVLLIPVFLLVLDNFRSILNHVFYVLISALFLLYTLQWTNNIDLILKSYIPIVSVAGDFSIGVVTVISAILILWILELRQENYEPSREGRQGEHDVFAGKQPLSCKLAPLLPVFLIAFLFLVHQLFHS